MILRLGDNVRTKWPVPVKRRDVSDYSSEVLAGRIVRFNHDSVEVAIDGWEYPPRFPYTDLERV